jgi:hypothetical protein
VAARSHVPLMMGDMAIRGGYAPGRYGSHGGCLFAAAVVVMVCAALGGCVLWSMQRSGHPAPPDVKALADSPAAREADRAATASTTRQIARLRKATPWATYLDTSVTDLCQSRIQSAALTFHPHWSPVSCLRYTVVYAAFDGDIQRHLRQLDTAVGALPWQPTDPPGSPPGGLVAELAYLRQPPDGADPSPSTEAADGPANLSVRYARRGAPDAPAPAKGAPSLTVSVAQSPTPPQAGGWDDDGATGNGRSKRPYGNDDMNRSVYVTWHPLSSAAVAASAYTAHEFTMAVALSSPYFAQP